MCDAPAECWQQGSSVGQVHKVETSCCNAANRNGEEWDDRRWRRAWARSSWLRSDCVDDTSKPVSSNGLCALAFLVRHSICRHFLFVYICMRGECLVAAACVHAQRERGERGGGRCMRAHAHTHARLRGGRPGIAALSGWQGLETMGFHGPSQIGKVGVLLGQFYEQRSLRRKKRHLPREDVAFPAPCPPLPSGP